MRIRQLDLADALNSLTPNTSWSIQDDDYSTLEWHSEDVKKPTLKQLEAELLRLQSEQEMVAYRGQRALEYPDFREYLDGIVKGDNAQMQSYIDKCLAVKAKYPKPGE